MIAQKSLREANVLVGKFSQIRRLGAIVLAGFEQVWAVERGSPASSRARVRSVY